jgi:hypothetical protein
MRVMCVAALIAGLVLPAVGLCAPLQLLEDPGEGDFDVQGTVVVGDAAKFGLQVAFNYQEETKKHYLLTVSGGVAKLMLVGTAPRLLGAPVAVSLKTGAEVPFTLQRRQWRMTLVWNGTVILRAYDRVFQDGRVGSGVSGGTLSKLEVQPVGEMLAADDFMREEGAQSMWQPILGKWEARTLRDDEQAAREEADKSANAFSYFATGSPRGITIGGYPFWDRYSLESAVKAMGRGAVGVVCYYQDDKNYLLARWSSLADTGPQGNKLQLVAVRDGADEVLAEREGGYEPGQWYKLRAQVCDGIVQCLVDGELRLEATTDLFGRGQIGLYVEGQSGAFFDDVACNEWELFREGFSDVVAGKWRGTGFVQKNGVMAYSGKQRGLCVTGQAWERYAAAADVQAQGGAGVAFCVRGAADYFVLRVAPAGTPVPYAGKAQLVHFTAGGGSILAERTLPDRATKHQLWVGVDNGLLTGTVDDRVRLQAVVPGATGGAIALYADSPATFDNVRLSLLPAAQGSHVTREFAESDKHPEMAAWATPKAPWVLPAEGKDDWWTKGDYFGDTSVAFTIPAVGSKTGTARAMLGSEPEAKPGITLTVAATEKSKKLTLTLAAAEKELKQAEVEVEGDAHIVFSRESRLLLVRVNDAPVLSVTR